MSKVRKLEVSDGEENLGVGKEIPAGFISARERQPRDDPGSGDTVFMKSSMRALPFSLFYYYLSLILYWETQHLWIEIYPRRDSENSAGLEITRDYSRVFIRETRIHAYNIDREKHGGWIHRGSNSRSAFIYLPAIQVRSRYFNDAFDARNPTIPLETNGECTCDNST